MQFSHHSSNPLEVHTSDARNAAYHRQLAAQGLDESSDELGKWSEKTEYQSHVSKVVGMNLDDMVIPPFKGKPTTPVAGPSRRQLLPEYVDLDEDEDMESEDELATPYKEEYMHTAKKATKSAHKLFEDDEIVVDEQEEIMEQAGGEEEERILAHDEEEHMDEDQEHAFAGDVETWPQPIDYVYLSDDDEVMSPLTPLSDEDDLGNMELPPEWSSPQSSRPPSPDETRTLLSKPVDEQVEIEEEIEDLYNSVPVLRDNYILLDRLGTGTFSSVYKAIDLKYNEFDNHLWQGTHPANSTAYYQRAGPSYRGRGGRRTTKEDGGDPGDNNHEGMHDGQVFVAIKRIYTTSGPERIRNEIAIMSDCRGARHVSQIISAERMRDQVVIVLPYQRNMDFRDFFQTLHPEGIKCYFRCLFRALNDIHRRGIIHRDVKPANFLFDPFTGIGTLCDFGLASRMEGKPTVGECLHRPWSPTHPHGLNYSCTDEDRITIKQMQVKARSNSRNASDKVGYPEVDKRPISKANRAGTRGFRAPEVLLKCGSQTGAIDVWSAGVILLFFLTGKFPIFQSNDDVEGLMEIAVIIGRKKLEATATLHGRIVSTNIPSLDNDGITWQTFVERLNPDIYTPKKYDMRFYPHNCKHRDGPTSSLRAAAAAVAQQPRLKEDPPAPESLADALAEAVASIAAEQEDGESTPAPLPPDSSLTNTGASTTVGVSSSEPTPASDNASASAVAFTSSLTSTSAPEPAPALPATTTATATAASSSSDRYANPRPADTHKRDMKHCFSLLERILHTEATKRATPGKALSMAWLEEPGVGPDWQFAPLPPGQGVCGRWHKACEATGAEQVWVKRVCRCSEAEERQARGADVDGAGMGEGAGVGMDGDGDGGEDGGGQPTRSPPSEGKVLDVFDEGYQLAKDQRSTRERCCDFLVAKYIDAGEGIAYGNEPCEFHTDEFFRKEFVALDHSSGRLQ